MDVISVKKAICYDWSLFVMIKNVRRSMNGIKKLFTTLVQDK